MPKIRALITVEFESTSSQPAIIDQTLDNLLQPTCRIISRTISSIDDGSLTAFGSSGLQIDRRRRVDSFRPRYGSDRESAAQSSQRAGASAVISHASNAASSSRPVDSGLSPLDLDKLPLISHSARSLGTRYDALIDSTVSFHDIALPGSPSSGRARSLRSSSPYSPPSASHFGRDRSASPRPLGGSGDLRRSERLRDMKRGGSRSVGLSRRERKEAREPPSDRLTEWKKKQDRGFGRGGVLNAKERDRVGSGSLEALANDANFKLSGSNKFEKQVQRHGVSEALRLQNIRTNTRINSAKRKCSIRRWEPGQVKEGDRLDNIIDQIGSFDFNKPPEPRTTSRTMTSMEMWDLLVAGHAPVETRKKKGGAAISPYKGGLTPSAHVIYDDADLAIMPELNLNDGRREDGTASGGANAMQLDANDRPVDLIPSGQAVADSIATKPVMDAMEDVS